MQVLGLFPVSADDNGQPARPYSYRADLLQDLVDLKVLPVATARVHRKIRDIFEHRLGIPMDLSLRSLTSVRNSDLVFAFLEQYSVLPSRLKSWRISPYSKRPLVVLSCWWAEEIVNGQEKVVKQISKSLTGIDGIICFSKNQRGAFHLLGFPEDRVFPVRFGVDPDYYRPDQSVAKDVDVLAAGIDRGRDYNTLVEAARQLPHRSFSIITQRGRITNPPPNVQLHEPMNMDDHRNNLRRARLVVVPTHDLQYPTGQSVLLEAMACGTATAVTSTTAMSDYIDDENWNLALPLHDSQGVASIIENALTDDRLRSRVALNGRHATEVHFHFRNTWHQVYEVFENVKNRRG